MAYKIEIINYNSLRVTDTINGDIEVSQPVAYMWYEEDSLAGGYVKFYSLTEKENNTTNKVKYNEVGNSFRGYAIDDCIDGDDVTFTISSFRDFATLNLGKRSGGASSLKTYRGIIDYEDTSADIEINTGNANVSTWIDLPNNGLGVNSLNTVDGVDDIIDTTTGHYFFSELNQGAIIEIRLNLEITTNTPNTIVKARLVLGGNIAFYNFAHRYYKSATTNDGYTFFFKFDVTSDAFYLNDGILQVWADDSTTITNIGVRNWITM